MASSVSDATDGHSLLLCDHSNETPVPVPFSSHPGGRTPARHGPAGATPRDELLEEIFLRLPTPAALARASTASPRFRRIITDRSFLRRFRKLHPPPLLGFADERAGFHPAEAPHPSAPLARALADAADFTYSFVPKPSNDHSWRPCNVRDGRVLLESSRYGTFRELAVCDPLSRRYVLLPPIPEHMSVQEQRPLGIQVHPGSHCRGGRGRDVVQGGGGNSSIMKMFTGTLASLHLCENRVYEAGQTHLESLVWAMRCF
ncbi:uncharacterized protein [Triticum aestivum]|uniref:uncharacterized protein n=1 Tax=Triticum aestivum TaxID=4565 RepID=UPI001D004C30|nr:uncharacterized protein LOC123142455 [Triticum aestivum]